MTDVLLWIAAVGLIHLLLKRIQIRFRNHKKSRLGFAPVISALTHAEATMLSGWILSSEQIDGFLTLAQPWGRLVFDSVRDLRKHGAALLPTLKRIRTCAEYCQNASALARNRAAQARVQAAAGMILVPGIGIGAAVLLPELRVRHDWWMGVGVCSLWVAMAGWWISVLIGRAQWGGLTTENRDALIRAPIAAERLMSALSSGLTPDVAWSSAVELFPDWNRSLWDTEDRTSGQQRDLYSEILKCGTCFSKAIHWAVWEGKPCQAAIEVQILALQSTIQHYLDRETSLLATRMLLPLFVFVAPSVLGLLGWSLCLTMMQN